MTGLFAAAPSAVSFDTPANIAFAVIAVVMVIAAVRVVTTRNVVHAALWLMIVLGGNGLLYLLLQAEFVAMTQFLVYLGAIVVLFLFGIMLTRAPLGRSDDLDNDQRWMGVAVSLILLVVIGYSLIKTYSDDKLTFGAVRNAGTNAQTQDLATSIFVDYLVPFEVVSVLLLAALIGAIVLARRD
ncbi:MAG TPA: NADH-quinone oxidoreductase subunit J [Microthrixaceae bacterium]|nr:NADH-quinone oxidoreductase subunit J [Microthrixaceae bacterium]HNJ70510.1 NADH-quinone oxidoreductase subunit J [Microthrixaceae bacterium]